MTETTKCLQLDNKWKLILYVPFSLLSISRILQIKWQTAVIVITKYSARFFVWIQKLNYRNKFDNCDVFTKRACYSRSFHILGSSHSIFEIMVGTSHESSRFVCVYLLSFLSVYLHFCTKFGLLIVIIYITNKK